MKKLAALHVLDLLTAGVAARGGWLPALFSTDYLPHRTCYRGDPGLVWTNVIADALIAGSYVLIFACLLWTAQNLRKQAQLRGYIWVFVAFGTFILSCAVTHLMELITVWLPFYPLAAALKVVCAVVSVPTAILFFKAAPAIVAHVTRFFDLLSQSLQAEQASAADYRGQIEAIDRSHMRIEFNMDGRVLWANENCLRIFGYTRDEMSGKEREIFIGEGDRQGSAHREFWAALRLGQAQTRLLKRFDKQGCEVWMEASYSPVLGAVGSPGRVIAIASDVSERVRFQNQLQAAEARLKAIVDSVADGIITITATGTITSFNPAATQMFEYEEAEIAGKNIRMLMPEPDSSAHEGILRATNRPGNPP